jgi:hypothetical protein
MITAAIFFPLLILVFTRSFNLKIVRLFAHYLCLGTLLQMLLNVVPGFPIALFILLAWGIMESGNLEHVINNNANQNFKFVKFLFDPVFMKGSGLSKRFALRTLFILLVVSGIALFERGLSTQTCGVVLISALFVSLLIPRSSVFPDWTQESWFVFNLRILFGAPREMKIHQRSDVKFSNEKLGIAADQYRKLRPKELGTKTSLPAQNPKNVLFIMVEGLGEIHFQKGWLPKLQKRRKENLSCKTFLNHQRNTNRGVYSLFTGQHPNLVNMVAKPDLVAQYGKMDTGIGEVLSKHGMRTIFMQGAPTVFMSKDRFLQHLGFEEIIGEEQFPKGVPRIKWGVDDHWLYEMAYQKIQTLKTAQTPWFLSLLTVTTHHPIEASNKVLKTPEDGFRYADEELDLFLERLEKAGFLDSTMVVITSEETTGDGSHVLSENLGTLVIQFPQKVEKKITEPFSQSDLAFSLCDVLGIDDHPFSGRSLFRSYEDVRPLYFASIFQQKVFLYENQKLFIQHYSGKKEVLSLSELSLDSAPTSAPEIHASQFQELQSFVKASDRGLEFLTNPVILDIAALSPNGTPLVHSGGEMKIGLKKGELLKLRFSGENQHSDHALVVTWLIKDMKNKRSFKPNLVLLPGTNDAFEKTFTSPSDSWYDVSIRVAAQENQSWILKDLQVTSE